MIANIGLAAAGQAINTSASGAGNATVPGNGAVDLSGQFGSLLETAMNQLNMQKEHADDLARQFAAGQMTDVHQLMIASEKASLGLELTVQVRNKVIEAYQEIMRMQF